MPPVATYYTERPAMSEYPKINAPFHRDMTKPGNPLVIGKWSEPEFEYLKDCDWEWTEKIDGTNIRILLSYSPEFGLSVGYRGRTDNADIPPHLRVALDELFATTARVEHVNSWMESHDLTNVVLYGEGYGPKIQGGGKYRPDPSFVLFDVRVGDFWLDRTNVNDVASKLGLDSVPVVGYGSLAEAIDRVKNRLESMWGEFEAEGLVVRPNIPLFNRKGHRITTKIKARDFK